MPKKNTESPDVIEKKSKEEIKEKKPREKKAQYEGSRWSSLVVLILFVVIGLVLSVTSGH